MPVLTFMKEAVTSFRQLGTFIPTQPWLARDIARSLPRREGIRVVELGAGEGSITRAIVRELGERDYRFLVIEANENLLVANRQSLIGWTPRRKGGAEGGTNAALDGRLLFLRDDALALGRILDEWDISSVDAIVSSLPLAYFTPVQRRDLFALAKGRLVDAGVFVQYRYTPVGMRELQPYFSQIERRYVPHFLPAWVYVCGNAVAQPGGNGYTGE